MTCTVVHLQGPDSLRRAAGGVLLKAMAAVMGIGAALTSLVLLYGADGNAPDFRRPQSVVKPLVIGRLPVYVSHRFEFRNDADSAIAIEKVETNCSCTAYESSVGLINPGETGFLSLEMGMYQSGSKSTQAEVAWSSGEKTVFTLQGQARATVELGSSTRRVEVSPGASAEINLWLSTLSEAPPSLSVESAGAGVSVQPGDWRVVTKGRIDAGVSRRYATRLTIAADSTATGASYVVVQAQIGRAHV